MNSKKLNKDNANQAPIGIFDSGVGGLTVARSIIDQLYNEDIFYLGDTARGPYGSLPLAKIREYALDIADKLIAKSVKVLVIACNSASAACLKDARERYKVPVVEVIMPTVRRALAVTKLGKIGIIGTSATINSGSYQDFFSTYPNIELTTVACPEFVNYVERGITSGVEIESLAHKYLAPMRAAGVDTLVLGCTHYPFLSGVLQLVMGAEVTLVSSAEETTKELVKVLSENNLLKPTAFDVLAPKAKRVFQTTGNETEFITLAQRFIGSHIG